MYTPLSCIATFSKNGGLFRGFMLDLNLKQSKYRLPYLPFFDKLNDFINSKWFVFLLAVFTIFNNVYGFDLLFFSVVALIAIYVSVFGKDYLSYIPMMVFCYIALSVQNNPSKNPSSILLPANNGNLIYLLAGLVIIALVIRWLRRYRKIPEVTQ